jgi:DNA repair exonuclease SbcCD ATPase subunit
VENPVAILDQEEAKKFLTGKASDKYAFYMKATELERIDRTYQTTLDSMNDMVGQKARMEKNLQHDQLLVKQCKEEWDKHQELDKLKEKQEKLMEGFAWSCYQKAQNTLDLEMMVRT